MSVSAEGRISFEGVLPFVRSPARFAPGQAVVSVTAQLPEVERDNTYQPPMGRILLSAQQPVAGIVYPVGAAVWLITTFAPAFPLYRSPDASPVNVSGNTVAYGLALPVGSGRVSTDTVPPEVEAGYPVASGQARATGAGPAGQYGYHAPGGSFRGVGRVPELIDSQSVPVAVGVLRYSGRRPAAGVPYRAVIDPLRVVVAGQQPPLIIGRSDPVVLAVGVSSVGFETLQPIPIVLAEVRRTRVRMQLRNVGVMSAGRRLIVRQSRVLLLPDSRR